METHCAMLLHALREDGNLALSSSDFDTFFDGHGAEWSKIFLYGQLHHAMMRRFEQKLDAANAGKEQNSQISNLLQLAQAEKKGGDKSCVTQPIELSELGT